MLKDCPEEKKEVFTNELLAQYSKIVFHEESKIKLL